MKEFGELMMFCCKLKVLIFSLFFFLSSTISAATIDPSAFYVDKDHPSASNSNSGTASLPWKTIQHGVNQLTPGKRLYVRQSIEPYFEPYRSYGTDLGGVTVDVSGTSTNKIYIEGYPGDTVVINQQRGTSSYRAETGALDVASDSKPLTGFFINKGNYVVIKNFEITQTSASGIMFHPGNHNLGVEIEGNNIHHLYGSDNVGGIRLDHADYAIVRNNIIHDIMSTGGSSNPYNSEPYKLDSGIHGYESGNALIEYNVIYNVDRGIFAKASDADGLNAATVRRNLFFNNGHSAYALEVQGSGSAPALNAEFYENIVYNSRGGVSSGLAETSGQSTSMVIYNNTFHNLDYGVSLTGQIGVKVHSNIFSSIQGMNISIGRTLSSVINRLDYVDNNLYFNEGREWALELYASNNEIIRSISDWKSSYSRSNLNVLSANPDVNSILADPQFTNVSDNNFTLNATSPAGSAYKNGYNDNGIGAYGLGASVIGISGLRSKAITDLN